MSTPAQKILIWITDYIGPYVSKIRTENRKMSSFKPEKYMPGMSAYEVKRIAKNKKNITKLSTG